MYVETREILGVFGQGRQGSVAIIPRRVLSVLSILSFVAAVAVLPVHAVAQPPVPAPPPIDRRVFVLGDSVILGAQAVLAGRLGATGWQVTQYAAESLHSYNAAPVIDSSRPAIGEVVVVALGHNDHGTPGQFTAWVEDLMSHLRDVRQVFWVNLRSFSDWAPAANVDLAAAAQRWPNLRIIDWDARSTPDPGLVYADGIHLTPIGQVSMADLIGVTLDTYGIARTMAELLGPVTFF